MRHPLAVLLFVVLALTLAIPLQSGALSAPRLPTDRPLLEAEAVTGSHLSIMTVNRLGGPVSCTMPIVAPGWAQVRTSNVDFDGDGRSDLLLWQGDPTQPRFGDVVAWLQDGCTIHNSMHITTVVDPNWLLTSFGDYDGDGRTDIVWAFLQH